MNNQAILDVLNSLEVIETNGGEDAYVLVENNEENRKELNAVGVTTETINKYGDEETFCILTLAFGEGYADWYENDKLIKFEKEIELEFNDEYLVTVFKHDGEVRIALAEIGGMCSSKVLSQEEINKLKEIIQ